MLFASYPHDDNLLCLLFPYVGFQGKYPSACLNLKRAYRSHASESWITAYTCP